MKNPTAINHLSMRRLSPGRLHYLFFTVLLLSMVFTRQSYGQTVPGGPDGLTTEFVIFGTRNTDPTSYSSYFGADCNDDFLFLAYVGDNCTLMAGIPETSYGFSTYNIDVTEDGVWTGTRLSVASGDDQVFNFSTPGMKKLKYTDVHSGKSWTTKIIIHKKITKIWLEAPDLCAETHPVGQPYKFKIRTEPESLLNILSYKDEIERSWDGYDCENQVAYQASASFDMGYSIFDPPVRYQGASSTMNYFVTATIPPTANWPISTAAGGGDEEYYISYSDLLPNLTSNPAPLRGTLTLFDGISYFYLNLFIPISATPTASNHNNETAFLINSYDKTTAGVISGHTAEPSGTLDAPAIETWSPTDNPIVNEGYGGEVTTIRIKDKLVIGKGQRLTINNMIVEMGKDAQIIVENDPTGVQNAGVLVLNNSTIRAYRGCGDNSTTWKGIILQGNSMIDQDPVGGDYYKRNQAMLQMSTNSNIAYAQTAVRCYDPSVAGSGGGIVYAANSSFTDNLLAIDFAPYPGTYVPAAYVRRPYAATFTNCSFQLTENDMLMDFKGFVEGSDVNGVKFQSCSFINNVGTTMAGFGIHGQNMGISVYNTLLGSAPCFFKGLNEAIKLEKGRLGGIEGTTIVRSQFVQNYTGAHLASVANPNVSSNSFQIPSRPTPSFFGRNAAGVNIETGSGYTVSGNTFDRVGASGTSSNANAVLVWNSGSADNFVKNNTTANLQQGMISNYRNTNSSALAPHGLQFLCNTQHNNVSTSIAALGSNPGTDGMRANQGSITNPAANTFAHIIYDIYNPATQVGAVSYYYNSPGIYYPSLIFGTGSAVISSNPESCSGILSDPATDPTSGLPLPRPLPGLSGIDLREALHWNVSVYAANPDATDRNTNLHSTLNLLNDPYSDLTRTELYIEERNFPAAISLYDGIVSKFQLTGKEAGEFSTWGRMLLQLSISQISNGQEADVLSAAQLDTLQTVADSASMWARVRAQNWLHRYDGRTLMNNFLYPEDGANLSRSTDESAIAESAANAVYPNPAGAYVHVRFSPAANQESEAVLSVQDVLGRELIRQTVAAGTSRITVQNLHPGVYFYTLYEQHSVILKGTFVKQ